jgi:ABC-type amino acid transport substrate-binding protein
MLKYIVFASFLVLLLAASPARAGERVYRVAVDTYYPPFSYTDEKTGQLAGFDVDIARAVCGKLKITCEIKGVSFNDIIPQLEAGQLDIGSAGFSYTEERAKRVLYTRKYFRSSSLFLELPGTFTDITPETLKGKKVAAQAGTTQEEYLRRTYGESIELVLVESFGDILKAVNDRTADLGFIEGLPGYYYLKSEEGMDLDFVGAPVHLDGGSCMVLRKGDEALRDRINQAIDDLRRSGEYDAINRKYFEFSVY